MRPRFLSRRTSGIRPPIHPNMPGHIFSRPCFRWACNLMCKSKLWSEKSTFPTFLPLGTTYLQFNFDSSAIRTHPTIQRSMHPSAKPNFCRQTFVNGNVASPKNVAGDTTVSIVSAAQPMRRVPSTDFFYTGWSPHVFIPSDSTVELSWQLQDVAVARAHEWINGTPEPKQWLLEA